MLKEILQREKYEREIEYRAQIQVNRCNNRSTSRNYKEKAKKNKEKK